MRSRSCSAELRARRREKAAPQIRVVEQDPESWILEQAGLVADYLERRLVEIGGELESIPVLR